MNQEPNPNQPAPTPGNQVNEATQKAQALAKEGIATLKALDRNSQIYLGGLAVAFICGTVFSVISIQMAVPNELKGMESLLSKASEHSIPSAINAGGKGTLAVLSALAGLGIWIYNFKSAKKETWVPLALTICAGLSALLYLSLFSNSQSLGFMSVSMTVFGYWLPLAGAITATVIAVKKLKNAQSPRSA